MIPLWGYLSFAVCYLILGLIYFVISQDIVNIRLKKYKKPYRVILRVLLIIFWLPHFVFCILTIILVSFWDIVCSIFEYNENGTL